MRNSTVWPTATRGMSSSLTSATICSGFGTPTRNRICPTLDDLADLAVAAQHDSVHRSDDRVLVDPLRLDRDLSLNLLQVHRGALIGLRRRGAAADQLADARHLLLRRIPRAPPARAAARGPPLVEVDQHVALGDRLALAVAKVDDAVAQKARYLGPMYRLDRAGRVDDLDRRAAHRRHGAHHRHRAHEPPPAGGNHNGHAHQGPRQKLQPSHASLECMSSRRVVI